MGELLALEAKFHARIPAYKDPRYDHPKKHFDYATELNRTGVTRPAYAEGDLEG